LIKFKQAVSKFILWFRERETIEVFLPSTYEVEMIDVQEQVEAEAGHDNSMGSLPQPSTSKGARSFYILF
jgi:hypothetical protein